MWNTVNNWTNFQLHLSWMQLKWLYNICWEDHLLFNRLAECFWHMMNQTQTAKQGNIFLHMYWIFQKYKADNKMYTQVIFPLFFSACNWWRLLFPTSKHIDMCTSRVKLSWVHSGFLVLIKVSLLMKVSFLYSILILHFCKPLPPFKTLLVTSKYLMSLLLLKYRYIVLDV